jgi:multiple sugar transport system ATP-binding protein
MATIELKQVQKVFGSAPAVLPMDLTVQDGEFVSLLGPSGCGKTTTLRMISGLETVSGGQILLNGRDVTFAHPSDRDIAYVFQFYALYPHMTAWENIAFPLQAQKVEKAEVERRVKEVADLLKITSLLKLRPGALSGGDQQRVALARALVRRPAAFLMDEPLGALDADFREQMRAEIKQLHLSIHATSVYVTHDQIEAMAMADRIVVMSRAAVQQIGTPAEVYYNPANLFVANFIGSPGMNLVKGLYADGAVRFPGDQQYQVPGAWQKTLDRRLGGQGEVVVGFRPEAGVLDSAQPDFNAAVYAVDVNGSDNLLYLSLGEQSVIRIRVDRSVKPAIGDNAPLRLDPTYVRFFDTKTEAALALEA